MQAQYHQIFCLLEEMLEIQVLILKFLIFENNDSNHLVTRCGSNKGRHQNESHLLAAWLQTLGEKSGLLTCGRSQACLQKAPGRLRR